MDRQVLSFGASHAGTRHKRSESLERFGGGVILLNQEKLGNNSNLSQCFAEGWGRLGHCGILTKTLANVLCPGKYGCS